MKQPLKGYLIEKYNHMGEAYTCARLLEEAKALGVDLRIIGIHDTKITQAGLENEGNVLKGCDFVINRYKTGNIKEEINRLAIKCYNNTNVFNQYINKYEQVKKLKSSAFYMPKYLLGTLSTDYDYLMAYLKSPFIAKGLESSQGTEVFLIHDEQDYEELQRQYSLQKEILFEEYIETSYGRDIRFYSIRGNVIACMTREAVSGFKANVALGANVHSYEITEEIKQVAKDIYEQTGLDFLGIDLLFGTDKPYFCEINVMPGMEGIERATNVNVAKQIIETIIEDFVDEYERGCN